MWIDFETIRERGPVLTIKPSGCASVSEIPLGIHPTRLLTPQVAIEPFMGPGVCLPQWTAPLAMSRLRRVDEIVYGAFAECFTDRS